MNRLFGYALIGSLAMLGGCASQQRNLHSSAVEYLYSGGYDGAPASVVKLRAPVRVGIAFAPSGNDAFPEEKKQQLLKRISDAFRADPKIAAIEIIPSTYLNPRGGFDELDRLRAAFRISEIVLISYEQIQFSDTGAMGLTYWAYGVPAYVVKGEKNETRTFVDAVALDIPSRVMLFHAAGQSSIKGSSTLVGVNQALRERGAAGFDEAIEQLIPNLDVELKKFEASVTNGEIAVEATPKIPAWNPTSAPAPAGVTPSTQGQGANDAVTVALLLGLLALARRDRRRAERRASR
jgi:rhombotail lipoprotein